MLSVTSKNKEDKEVYVSEHRDVQDLSISVASKHYDDKVILPADRRHLSRVNREAFFDQ